MDNAAESQSSGTEQSVKAWREDLDVGIPLASGSQHKIEFDPGPAPNSTHSVPAAVFAFDSAFPGPGIAVHLKTIQEATEEEQSTRVMVFGHADPKGNLKYNKELSERRAQAVLALVIGDPSMFDQVAKADKWSLKHYQAMLRAVGCNPGAIDGQNGAMTKAAVRGFQEEYNRGVYHDEDQSKAHPDLAVDGLIGPKTEAAIRDAYVAEFTALVLRRRLAAGGIAGCSELNPVWPTDEENRRVVVALFAGQKPKNTDFPCKMGDISACPAESGEKVQCHFYRRYVKEQKPDDSLPVFYDFQWLKEESGEAHLSAITTLPDDTAAKFTIYRCEKETPMPPPDSSSGEEAPDVGPEIGSVDGKIVGGIAFARWSPPDDYDPFDFTSWLVDHDLDIEAYDGEEEVPEDDPLAGEKLLAADGMQPPIFRIDADDNWGYSGPPGHRLNRVHFIDGESAEGLAIRNDGSMIMFETQAGAIDAADDMDVVALVVAGKDLEDETGEPLAGAEEESETDGG